MRGQSMTVLLAVALSIPVSATCPAQPVTSTDGPAPDAVPLWGRFETRVANERTYANPFADVVLNATFRSPTGREARFIGYYDGDGGGHQEGTVWRLRYMPDEPGEWTYFCSFSDGAPGGSGSFMCTRVGAHPGPLRKDPAHPSSLRFADGMPFYPRCYYLSEAFMSPPPLWEELLDRFFGGAYHYNLSCTTFWQGRLLEQNRWNNLPYTGFYPTVGGDYTRLDVAAWRHVDEVLRRMEDRRTVWFNFDGFVPNVGGGMGAQRMDFAAQSCYIRNAVARLAPYWNIIWNIAFEWSEFMAPADVARLADYTRGLDPWGHLVTVHDQGPYQTMADAQADMRRSDVPPGVPAYTTGAEVVADLHVDLVTLQYQAGTAPSAVAANRMVRQFSGDWPVFGQEMAWEATPGKLTGEQVRHAAWGIVLAGGFPCYAEMLDGPNWRTPANYGDGAALPYLELLHDSVSALPYEDMRPHNELVSSGKLCLAKPGECYLCYAEAGGGLTLDLSAAEGPFGVQWLNPRTGERTAAGDVMGGGPHSLQTPDGGDWVLLVTLAPTGGG